MHVIEAAGVGLVGSPWFKTLTRLRDHLDDVALDAVEDDGVGLK